MVRLLHYSDIENVYDDPERAGRLAACISDLHGPDALVVGTGDNTAPGVLALVARGRQALEFFTAIDATVETFGNHDFDFGPDATRELVADSPQTWVSTNVYDGPGEVPEVPLGADSGDELDSVFGAAEGVVPWTVETVAGADVGVFGVTDPATDSLNPMAADLAFTDPYEAAERAAGLLRSEGVDHVVAASHLGGGDDELARRADVDLVLGGHVHTERAEEVDGVLCTRPGVNGEAVLEIELTGDGATATRHDPSDWSPNERLADALRERMHAAGLDQVVGHVDEPIERTEGTIHGGESRVGNLVADAYRYAADADVGLQNAGGIRLGDDLAGDVTLADLISTVPFEEPVVTVELTGAELLDAFRQMSAAVVDFGEPHWWHGHVSGAEIVWDDSERELLEARVAGEPVDPDGTYRVATPEYLLHSDHEFPAIEERHRAAEHGIQHDVLAEYIRDHGLDARIEGRIRRVSGGVRAGRVAGEGENEDATGVLAEPTDE
ncbi:5'-nucleotidase C-terminal domain-containing protein [Halorarum halophilum]|uniref:5'-nucleotidase C-terminal domain-containing protein n=1 Tax=Halorarum halophilum TaxID=2743090 RepID=A0A7D5GDJ6_9EURY|nr:5'-nucleotidase C-terminal domain-containing protein [Halobaculum halophilum]QLG26688.1 5'-nucleotidase C-terminal domain-containing protein [Halobaculum halophilum]